MKILMLSFDRGLHAIWSGERLPNRSLVHGVESDNAVIDVIHRENDRLSQISRHHGELSLLSERAVGDRIGDRNRNGAASNGEDATTGEILELVRNDDRSIQGRQRLHREIV